jgi:hypothetical protein
MAWLTRAAPRALRTLPISLAAVYLRRRPRTRTAPPTRASVRPAVAVAPAAALLWLEAARSAVAAADAPPPPTAAAERLTRALARASAAAARLPEGGTDFPAAEAGGGIDRTLLQIRCLADEAREAAGGGAAAGALLRAARAVADFQGRQRARAETYVDRVMTAGGVVRAAVFSRARRARALADEREREGLAARGASVREMYGLLWEQQLRRRQSVARMAEAAAASGVVRFVVSVVAGVPEDVLALARGLGQEGGAAGRALRERFGADLAALEDGGVRVRAVAARLAAARASGRRGAHVVDCARALSDLCEAYEHAVKALVAALEDAVLHDPAYALPDAPGKQLTIAVRALAEGGDPPPVS